MMEAPYVSVVMGVYRPQHDYLLESVKSLIAQSFENWELIICNDGSGDNEVDELLREVAALDTRVRVIGYPENKGLAYALNECIRKARGEYIARQDDDDQSRPLRLEKQVHYLNNHPNCAYVGSEATVFDVKGPWGYFELEENPTAETFLWNSPYIHPTVVFRKAVLDAMGGYRVDPRTERVEDYDLFLTLTSLGYLGHNIKQDLYEYRINRSAEKYRSMKIRVNEACVRARGFKRLGFGFKALPYIAKPVILGLLPGKLMGLIRRSRYRC